MKLDNRGWGLREMLIYSSILLLFLLIASFRMSALYNDINSTKDEPETFVEEKNSSEKGFYDLKYYYDYEDKMIQATRDYLKKYEYNVEVQTLKIDLSTLIDLDLIDKLYDKDSNVRCEGYVMVTFESDKEAIKPYLMCGDYVTKGY